MIPVLSAAQMRQLDEETIDAAKVPGRALMELAADGIVRRLEALQEEHQTEPSALVLVGSGNNGGDGLVVARRLFIRGWRVEVVLSKPSKSLTGDAEGAWLSLLAEGFENAHVFSDDALAHLAQLSFTFTVDALLGTGVEGEPRGALREVLAWQATLAGTYRIAVDIPSGLNSETSRLV